ncbi:MAG: PEP-CTERM sorting domain-containing protein [Spirulina sp.]
MKKVLLALLGTAVLGAIAAPAEAAILSVGSGGQKINAPYSVWDDDPGEEHPSLMLGFDEKQDVLLTRDIQIDNIGENVWIPKGTRVDSHMIFLNTPTSQKGRFELSDIRWEFDANIIGVMSDPWGKLEGASTDLLGHPNTIYPDTDALGRIFQWRGMEDTNDFYNVVGTNKLEVSMSVTEPGDWIRVVTYSVPEPTSILGLLAIVALGGSSMLKRQNH